MESLAPFNFSYLLLKWFEDQHRPMPWKGIKDPYLIWLSEIILQQTRVQQGLPYFERFKKRFPSIRELADASEDEVMKLWEGLGYYSRARNMHTTAKKVAYDFDGIFPSRYEDILALKGIGPYTAAAIASFAFNEPRAVIDGNVYRVLARIFGIHKPIDSTNGKKAFAQLADQLLDRTQPGVYNQAIMDFGATQCIPKNPNCTLCPMVDHCVAHREKLITKLPFKEKKIKKRTRNFTYLVINYGSNVLLQKRLAKDIWQKLYQFPLIETHQLIPSDEVIHQPFLQEFLGEHKGRILKYSKPFQQQLSHQRINAVFVEIQLLKAPKIKNESYFLAKRKNLNKFAFPKIIDWYLQDKSLYLELY